MEQQVAPTEGVSLQEKTGESSKWDHHITLAIVITTLSVIVLNLFGLVCGIAAIYFACRVSDLAQHKTF